MQATDSSPIADFLGSVAASVLVNGQAVRA